MSNLRDRKRLIARLRAGADTTVLANLEKADLEGANLEHANLEHANLKHANLKRANLEGAHLEKANLTGAHLEDANLRGVHLEDANLRGAYLEGANLTGARLERAYLGWAYLEKANLQQVHLEGADLESANLVRAILSGGHLEGSNLERAHLRNASLGGADLSVATLVGANLERAYLGNANLKGANMARCYLKRANLSLASLEDAHLECAYLSAANLERASLKAGCLKEANLVAVTLTGANLLGADLTGASLARALLLDTKMDKGAAESDPTGAYIDWRTVARSLRMDKLRSFLVRSGMPDIAAIYLIESLRTIDTMDLFTMLQSVFLSYGGPDETFAENLRVGLSNNGVKTWFFPRDAHPGARMHRQIRVKIYEYDRMILCCSEASLQRDGVLSEIEEVLEREQDEGGTEILIPILLDPIFDTGRNPPRWWPSNKQHIYRSLRQRVAADFRDAASDPRKWDEQLGRVLVALRKRGHDGRDPLLN